MEALGLNPRGGVSSGGGGNQLMCVYTLATVSLSRYCHAEETNGTLKCMPPEQKGETEGIG